MSTPGLPPLGPPALTIPVPQRLLPRCPTRPVRARGPFAALLVGVALVAAPAAAAEGPPAAAASLPTAFPSRDFLTGSWGGTRDEWNTAGVVVNLNYATETLGNVSGGERTGWAYADNIALDVRFDLDRLVGLGGTTLLVKLSERDGQSVSARFVAPSEGGNTFTVQELYGGQTLKLANVQFTTLLVDGRLDLAYGRLIANDDFLRSDLYCQFVNNSFCGSPKPVFLQNPFTFTAYPLATWGVRARYDTPARDWTFQAALYDGDPEGKGATRRARGATRTGPGGVSGATASRWRARSGTT